MANRLGDALSPYLLQHADNPVDWWPWSAEAFAEAERRDVPVLLSVGYAACHWCHVMAHESFEDPRTAEVVNEHFVAVKVDREERPDVDAVYMQATQALTGQGGWPMTVFLTPDRQPFYAGTYFPPEPRHGMPAFAQVLEAITAAWTERRDQVQTSAAHIVAELSRTGPDLGSERLQRADLETAVSALRSDFDQQYGGFGGAPKFPPSMVLEALFRIGDPEALDMAVRTCDAMARGGLYDQLAGGFARYSVDARWVVPHFEKMLYDNALLLGVYLHWWRLTGNPLAERVVTETVDWLLAEMRTAEGGFAASLDADSLDERGESREGAYYAWHGDQLAAVLGQDDGRRAADMFGVTALGTFEHALSTLQLVGDPDPDRRRDLQTRLRTARDRRARPGRDDKVVVAWNGWLIDALTQAAMALGRPEWLAAAVGAAELLWRVHWVARLGPDDSSGRLRRTSKDGRVGDAPGILEDYGALIQAFTRVASATADPVWVRRAGVLVAVAEDAFADGAGGYFDTAADAEPLYTRPRDVTDNATPSGLSAVVAGLGLYARLTGDPELAERAEVRAATGAELVRKAPRFAGWLLADAAGRWGSRTPVEVAITGDPDDPETARLVRVGYRHAPAGSVLVAGPSDSPGLALLADRPQRDGRPTAYVCRGFVCQLPVTTAAELQALLLAPTV